MAHNAKIWPSGLTNGVSKIAHGDLEALDTNAAAGINGDTGGSWAPSAAIIVTGQGWQPTLAVGQYPNFAADAGAKRTFVRRSSMAPVSRLFPGGLPSSGSLIQGQATGLVCSTLLQLPHNSTLTQVKIYIQVGSSHLPAVFPNASIQRLNVSTGVLTDTCNAADPIAFTPAPGTAAAWFAAGAIQSWTYTCNQKNLVDRTLYHFLLSITDESGAGALAGNLYWGYEETITLPDLEPA